MQKIVLSAIIVYLSWLGMLLVHEFGHILHAMLSGGHIASVSIPLFGFSQTIVDRSAHELFIVWGGPVWGSAIPVIACVICRLWRRKIPETMKFFAGFCLVANGVYIGAGRFIRAGDAGDLIRLGTPAFAMFAFGVLCTISGLFFWHQIQALTRKPTTNSL